MPLCRAAHVETVVVVVVVGGGDLIEDLQFFSLKSVEDDVATDGIEENDRRRVIGRKF